MTAARKRPAVIIAGILLGLLAVTLQGVQGEGLEKVPSEDQCRPYIEKALKDLEAEESTEDETNRDDQDIQLENDQDSQPDDGGLQDRVDEGADENDPGADAIDLDDDEPNSREQGKSSAEEPTSQAEVDQVESTTAEVTSVEADQQDMNSFEALAVTIVDENSTGEDSKEGQQTEDVGDDDLADLQDDSAETTDLGSVGVSEQEQSREKKEDENDDDESGGTRRQDETAKSDDQEEAATADSNEEADKVLAESIAADEKSNEEGALDKSDESKQAHDSEDDDGDDQKAAESVEEETIVSERFDSIQEKGPETVAAAIDQGAETNDDNNAKEDSESNKDEHEKRIDEDQGITISSSSNEQERNEQGEQEEEEGSPEEEELIMEIEIPEVLRPRDHIGQLLKLDEENEGKEKAVEKVTDLVLKDLKRLYDNAIKPLETLYKYRDLSNRHFGDPEIFSKPLVLFMGPWSGGKSSIINYLLDIEYKPTSLRTGAEPSPAYFNILMHGEEEEVLDGTQLAADWTFSGLQKFGQGLLDRLHGYKLNSKLLEKVNIVEIPGILEIRKQVQRLFPFNDACQWFIDRADIIFLVYDPAKLDVGPETEAILDQLKGREYQTRIILNKADQVKPEELMRVQGALIWNISPLMSSAEPPIMYSASLWSRPYEAGAPTRLLYAQERALLRDLRSAVDKRVEHKIASARRFAVRVRNHAKMVDCYLTTYYNHKSFFAKKKDVAERIVENPQDYHIYEGLSTLTNISRYDLPDPDVYRDFFRLNNLYEFPLLSSTCTYFRGCPINRLDVAIAYDLPELIGKYKRSAEAALQHVEAEEEVAAATAETATVSSTAAAAAPQQAQAQKAKSRASTMSLS